MLRSTNLNLIPVLRALLKEGGVSAAAKSVGLSQPATSNALTRLRVLLEDPLLFRVGQSMHLTPKAKRLVGALDDVCCILENILTEQDFDPRQARKGFVIAAADFQSYLIGDYLAERLPREAPNISIRFIDVTGSPRRPLESGELDLGLIRWTEGIDEGLSSKRGYGDRMIGVARRDHPLTQTPALDLNDLQQYSQIRHQRQSISGSIASSWPDLGQNISITMTQFISVAIVVSRSDSFTIVPKSIADHLKEIIFIDTFELPSASATYFDTCMMWGSINDRDPSHRWFRSVIDDALRSQLHGSNDVRLSSVAVFDAASG